MPDVSPVRTWRVERYRPGDEQAILELFRTVFGKSRSLEHWKWQFKDNPYGGPFVSIARREDDGVVVGSYSVMPVMLNVMGRAVPGCQSVDTAVHPDHRGQRMFEQTASDCYAWCASSGLKAVVGFPNANSYPGFMRALDWRRIAFPIQYTNRLGINALLRRATGLPLVPGLGNAVYRMVKGVQLTSGAAVVKKITGGKVTFHISTALPDGYDELWNAWRAQEVLSVWKDAAYLRWRYDQNPDHRFTYFHLGGAGAVRALAVGVEIDGGLVLCELLVAGRDVPLGRRLVLEICQFALDRQMKAVTFLACDAGFFDDVMIGFTRQKSYSNVYCGRAFEPGILSEILPQPHNWTVTFGDGDFV